MNKKYTAKDLINKYKQGLCTSEEQAIVESWYIDALSKSNYLPHEKELLKAHDTIWNALPVHQKKQKVHFINYWKKYAVAAVLLVSFSICLLFWRINNTHPVAQKAIKSIFKNDVNPGKDKAILTLADGKKIILNEASKELIIHDTNTRIKKIENGMLIYESAHHQETNSVINQLQTPKGGKYQVILADGTKVYLNAASILKYPTKFTGTTRDVELIGEGYFEVAKNKEKPFRVHTAKQITVVTGTQFNINSYQTEEEERTTLIEGGVYTWIKNRNYILKPGQQAIVGSSVDIVEADIPEAVAWKNGDFYFKNKNIKSIMRQIECWYDVEVTYQGNFDYLNYDAEISKNITLSKMLKILEQAGGGHVHFQLEGRRITLMK